MKNRYVVTRGSYDGTFQEGDHIIFYDDGSVVCVEANGFILKEEFKLAMGGLEYVPDIEYLNKQKAILENQIKKIIDDRW